MDLEVQPEHAAVMPMFWGLGLTALHHGLVGPWSWTAMQDRTPVAACGIMAHCYAWAFLAADMRRHLLPVTRAVQHVLDTHSHVVGPVLAHIDEENENAVRWAKFLGFKPDPIAGNWYFDARSL